MTCHDMRYSNMSKIFKNERPAGYRKTSWACFFWKTKMNIRMLQQWTSPTVDCLYWYLWKPSDAFPENGWRRNHFRSTHLSKYCRSVPKHVQLLPYESHASTLISSICSIGCISVASLCSWGAKSQQTYDILTKQEDDILKSNVTNACRLLDGILYIIL